MMRAALLSLLVLVASREVVRGEDEVAPVSAQELGFCPEQVSQFSKIKGYSKDICEKIASSPEFRISCAAVPQEDRIRCDGSDPESHNALRWKDWASCVPNVGQGIVDTYTEAGELAWSGFKSATNAGWWYFSGEEVFVDEPPAPSQATVDAFRAPAGFSATADVGAVASNTAEDEAEQLPMWKIMLMPEFYRLMASEIPTMLADLDSEFSCMNLRAQNDYVCYAAGAILGPGIPLEKATMKVGGSLKAFVKEMFKVSGKKATALARAKMGLKAMDKAGDIK